MMKSILIFTLLFALSGFAVETPIEVTANSENVITNESAPVLQEKAEAVTLKTESVESPKLAENEIPLNIGTAKKNTEASTGTTKVLLTMFIIGALMAVSYFGVRRYKTSNSIHKSNTKIKVISQHHLGPKKSLAIIHVAGESILIGVTDQNISMIKSLSLIDDEVPENLSNNFGQTLNQLTASDAVQKPGAGATSTLPIANAYELDEEFSFANVTDTVSKKIKSMRSIS